jgi:P4 family phage/plasmid primase-like protien
MSVIRKDAIAHKRLLHGNDPAIFQLFAEKGTNATARALSGTLKQHGREIDHHVRSGGAVGIAINTFRNGKRSSDNLDRINGFLLDCDGGVTLEDIESFAIPAHLVTETSPGHFHVLWLIAGCPAKAFRAIQKILARKLGGDLNVCDVARTMRLAGTVNRKNGQEHRVRIVSIKAGDDAKPIEFKAFVRAFDIKPKPKTLLPSATRSSTAPADLTDVTAALETISADDRQVWLRVGMALHSMHPGNVGKDLWDKWSRKASDVFDQKDQDRTWLGFKPNRGITKGTLFYLATNYAVTKKVEIPTTESDFAKLYVATYKDEIAYDHNASAWWVWDDIWKKAPHLAMRRCKAMVETIVDTVRSCNPDARNDLLKIVQRHLTTSSLSNILRQAAIDEAIEVTTAKFDSNPELLGVQNGVVELGSGMHRPGRAEDFITLQCGTSYEPAAKCSEFYKFIASITENDAAFAESIQRALGYSAFGHTKEQVFFMIVGPGANGKGVLLRTIIKALGNYAKTVAPNLLQSAYASNPNAPSPAVMTLKGSRLYACTEFDGKKRFDDAFIKQISGSDALTGRSNFGDQETFIPVGKLWLSLNSDPEIAYDNAAMWRRLRVIPLLRSFTGSDRDNDLETKLAAELPGILNWLIEGARMYHKDGLGHCKKVHEATDKLRERSDTVRSWFGHCCTKRGGAATQGANDVYRSYVAYTRSSNRTPLPIPKFNARLVTLGGHHVRRSTHNGWEGFVLRSN